MYLSRLHIRAIRNLHDVSLLPHPQFNLFVGQNGSGKTSLLEAIHLLALGRSFRSRQNQTVITYDAPHLTCFGEICDINARITLGIEKGRDGTVVCKRQGEVCQRLSDYATALPVQLMTPETFRWLLDGAQERRKYLDWGVFHVEHSFVGEHQRYQRTLKQRNAALKQGRHPRECMLWDAELVRLGERIALLRETYLEALKPFIEAACESWLPGFDFSLHYSPGWKEGGLADALCQAQSKDARYGFTTVGPHRAELEICVRGYPAHHVLSRGQQKLLIFAFYLAQGQQLWRQLGKKSVFLIDDLASELDLLNQKRLLAALNQQGHQVFLTATEHNIAFDTYGADNQTVFHVEHGKIRQNAPVPL